SLKVRTGVANPTPEELAARESRRIAREGLTIVHSLVARASTGDAIPVVRLIPARRSGRLTILAHPRGKAALATGSGEPTAPAPAADQMQDLATVLAWARAQPEIREVSLVAQDAAGYQALVARPALEGLARTVLELAGLPQSRQSDEWPATIDLPGLEQFGGV